MKQIVWEHWDSFAEIEDLTSDIEDLDEFDDTPDMKLLSILENSVEIVDTPLGRYQSTDAMLPSRMFDCWIMHTNFDIDIDCVNKIAQIPGIEAASVMTRYRVFIGIGKLFNSADTKVAVQNALLDDLQDVEIVLATEEEAREHEYWAGIKDEQGSVRFIYTNIPDDVKFEYALKALRKIADFYQYELIESPKNDVYHNEDKE